MLLALTLVLSMCVSPLSSLDADAAWNDDVASKVKVVAQKESVTAVEGEDVDLTTYFTINYDGAQAYALYGCDTGKFFAPSGNENYTAFKELLVLSYYKVEADGSETAQEDVPSSIGTYKVYAELPSADTQYYVLLESREYAGYFDLENIGAASLIYTITDGMVDPGTGGTEDPSTGETEDPSTSETEDPSSETPSEASAIRLKAIVGTELSFKTGDSVDLSKAFSIYWNDEEVTTCVWDPVYNEYYAEGYEDSEDALHFWEAYTVSYYDADGKELAEVPSKPGKYSASAKLTSSYAYYWIGLSNWIYARDIASDTINFTIEGDAENVQIKFVGDKQSFTESEEAIDLSDAFTVCYNGTEVYYLYEETEEGGTWYGGGYTPISKALKIHYYNADGEEIDAPATAGTYSVSAELKGSYYVYPDATAGLDDPVESVVSDKYRITIVEASSDEPSDTTDDEPLLIVWKGETTEFKATGKPVDLSPYFTFSYKGKEPVIIFEGYKNEQGYWIYDTGTEWDYVNYSDTFEGYVPFAELLVMHYYDADGKELESAPSVPGNYYVSADIPDITANNGSRCIYWEYEYNEETGKITADEHQYYYGVADSGKIAFTIKGEDAGSTAAASNTKGTTSNTAKTGDTSTIALYVVLIAACGIVVAVMVQKRRKNA